MNRRHPLPFLLLLMTLLLGALAAQADAPDTPAFAMADLDGEVHRLADYRGRWVVLNYWATWCPPCVEEIPELVDFQAANPRHVVLGINFEDVEPQVVRDFVREYRINYPVLPTGPTPPAFARLRGLPTTQIINPAGELVADHVGTVTRKMLEDFIAEETLAGRSAIPAD